MPLQVAGIERPPATVVGLHLRRDHDVGVDLGVIGPRRRLPERRHRQPARVRMQPATIAADPRRRPEPLQMLEHCVHGDVVSLQEAAVAGQPPPHRQRLRCRERRIEPRHRLHHPTITSDTIDQLAAERCPRNRVTARQQQLQRLRLDGARQAETGRLPPAPDARHLTGRCRSGTACSTPPMFAADEAWIVVTRSIRPDTRSPTRALVCRNQIGRRTRSTRTRRSDLEDERDLVRRGHEAGRTGAADRLIAATQNARAVPSAATITGAVHVGARARPGLASHTCERADDATNAEPHEQLVAEHPQGPPDPKSAPAARRRFWGPTFVGSSDRSRAPWRPRRR